ncbi:zf-RVT domain-containing protein, partial [Cephalotus follicularis]
AFIPQYPVVSWSNVVWFPRRIPKHSFCLWLTFSDAHKTLDKLHRVGVVQSDRCVFSCGQEDSVEHLFFACQFTATIWNHFLALCGYSRCSRGWTEESVWSVQRLQGPTFNAWITKLSLAATVYHCWVKRNNRIFNNSFRNCDSLIQIVASDIDYKCRGLTRVDDNPTNNAIFANWNLPTRLLSASAATHGGRSWHMQ